MKNSNPSQDHKHQHTESENDTRFNKFLQDLRDLRLQLHHAADSYQSTFLKSNQKQLVVKNTKEYVRNAMVTVVDHLGSISANLDHHLSRTGSIYETEVRIKFLNQKLLSCQEYSRKISLAKVSSRVDNLRYNSRYLKPPVSNVLKTMKGDDEFNIDEEVPLFFYTCNNYKSTSLLLEGPTSVPFLPVRDGFFVQTKPQSFQLQDKSKSRRGMLFMKSRINNEILSLGMQKI